ncbi:MAG: hypothetical protein PUH54_06630 [Oscillospiraceae bacterium]|nr:hypothetical protein [Oscillospiraceae bacterium]
MTKQENKNSAKKKLIPAVAMLTTSAVMLSTSTYAWFTMSREVEVNNISMTATTPEDIQISLGHLTNPQGGYADNTGLLKVGSGESATAADNGSAEAPLAGNTDLAMLDWTNSLEITEYYRLGRIIPASSTSGANIWFTPNATGVGKTVGANAKYYQATDGKIKKDESTVRSGANGTLAATLHAITDDTASNDKWNTGAPSDDTYSVSTGWNATNDDGYFVDIPIWLRTSSTEGVTLSLDAYVVPKTIDFDNVEDDDVHNYNDLYKAARVAIIPDAEDVSETGVNKLVNLKNGFDTNNHANLTDGYTGEQNIVDFYGRNTATGLEDSTKINTNAAANGAALQNYAAAQITENNAVMVNLTADENQGTGQGYGAAKKYYIRVWLEGEDPDCWNANAGQDFNISLKFSKINAVDVPSGS